MSLPQILAIIVFAGMFIAIMRGKMHRFVPALIGAAVTAVLILALVDDGPRSLWHVLRLYDFVDPHWWYGKHVAEAAHEATSDGGPEIGGVNWQTMIFIGGMMVMVEGMGAAGFFRWLCLLVAKLVRYRVIPILVSFMLLSGFLSMFIDSITVMLFLATVTIELARLLKFDPVPVIIAEIFASNTGGSATMSGDPPNIIIGTSLGYTFSDFVVNTGPIAGLSMIVALLYFYVVLRKPLAATEQRNTGAEAVVYPEPGQAIQDGRGFVLHSGIFVLVVVLLVTQALTGISVALIGVVTAVLTMLASGRNALRVLRNIDWRTLLFFIGLFMLVGALQENGVFLWLGRQMLRLTSGNLIERADRLQVR